jgi:hypothetical protein
MIWAIKETYFRNGYRYLTNVKQVKNRKETRKMFVGNVGYYTLARSGARFRGKWLLKCKRHDDVYGFKRRD